MIRTKHEGSELQERSTDVRAYISPSRLNLWLRCPLAFTLRLTNGFRVNRYSNLPQSVRPRLTASPGDAPALCPFEHWPVCVFKLVEFACGPVDGPFSDVFNARTATRKSNCGMVAKQIGERKNYNKE